MTFINIADLTNPATGKTYRAENNAKVHKFPVGSLVEINREPFHIEGIDDDPDDTADNGMRLFVTHQTRDCDGTPLYSLGTATNMDTGMLAVVDWCDDRLRILESFNGYGEESLTLIRGPEEEC